MHGGHQCGFKGVSQGPVPTQRAHPDEKGLFLCRPPEKLQISGFAPERLREL